MTRYGPDRQERVYGTFDENSGEKLPFSFEEWEHQARLVLEDGPYGYVAGAAGAEETMKANLKAFQRWRIIPRVLRDVSERDISVELFGRKLPAPFLLAPIGVLSILHPEAELAPARAAAKFGIPYILSNVSTLSLEKVAEDMGDAPRWFQLYPPRNRKVALSFLRRAGEAGYSAVVVTLDSTLLGWRERDLRNAYLPFMAGHGLGNYLNDPVFTESLEESPQENMSAAIDKILDEGNNLNCTWEYIDFLRENTRLPLILKGLTHPDDARLAVAHGVDGLIVSNHGGRQIDGGVATLDALPYIHEVVNRRVPVLLDGGIRRAADILKALALGATAVLIGRPYAYALAVAGESGVRHVIGNLMAEIDLQLGVSGRTCIGDIDRSLVVKAGH